MVADVGNLLVGEFTLLVIKSIKMAPKTKQEFMADLFLYWLLLVKKVISDDEHYALM